VLAKKKTAGSVWISFSTEVLRTLVEELVAF
jgi:hypothetical protein